VLLAENLTWAYYKNRARSARGPTALAYGAEARRWLRYDRARFDLYDVIVTVSELDAETAAGITSTQLVPIPGGVDSKALVPVGEPSGSPTAIFTGTLRWPPNAEGLRWLLTEVWPGVRRRIPEAKLLVVGAGIPDDARALADDSVEITGRVPELAPYFARASVVVIPILSGAGIRLKILDALASGRGVVSTRMGAEGTSVRDGEHAVLADDAVAFTEAVVALLEDPERCRELGAAGRALARERYDWGVVRASFERVLDASTT
jgi:glycosyltransferase involved in cell wall biosynthesis